MKYLIIIAAAGALLRFTAGIATGFLDTTYYNEYGDIANNIVSGKGYSFFYFEGDSLLHNHKTEARPYPSAYMPPGYVYYLVPAIQIANIEFRNAIFLFMHSAAGGIVIFLAGLITLRLFRNTAAAISAAVITALLPEFIYASLTFTPTIIYHGIVLALFLLYYRYREQQTQTMLIYLGAIFVAGVFFRPELLLLVLLTSALLFRFNKRHALLLLIIAAAGVMPWQFRNMAVFKEPVLLTTSSGLNFYRGHNPYEPGVWGDEEIMKEIKKYRGEFRFEWYYNNIYYEAAFEAIEEQPLKQIEYAASNLYKLILIDFNDAKSTHPLNAIPWILLLIAAAYGMYKTFSFKKYDMLYIFILYSAAMVIIFFYLPRYQTMMKIALIPFAAYTCSLLYNKIKPEKENSKKKETTI